MATTNYSWNLPQPGGSEDTWGTQLNDNWRAIDTLLGGVTALEFSYLDGLSSNVQTQIVNLQNGKQPIDAELTAIAALSPSNNNFIVGNGTTWVTESGSVALGSLGITASATEINYLSGATSNIQNQINSIVSGGGANNSTITITAGGAMAGGGSFTLNQATNASITLAHADTSSQSSVNNSGLTFIQDITLDTYGHIIAIGSGTVPTPSALSTASGSAPSYSARAWVSFVGPTTIRGSGNVSSVTSLGTGVYGVNFTTAMPDANYAAVAAVGTGDALFPVVSAVTTTSTTIRSPTRGDSISNSGLVSLIVCR